MNDVEALLRDLAQPGGIVKVGSATLIEAADAIRDLRASLPSGDTAGEGAGTGARGGRTNLVSDLTCDCALSHGSKCPFFVPTSKGAK